MVGLFHVTLDVRFFQVTTENFLAGRVVAVATSRPDKEFAAHMEGSGTMGRWKSPTREFKGNKLF